MMKVGFARWTIQVMLSYIASAVAFVVLSVGALFLVIVVTNIVSTVDLLDNYNLDLFFSFLSLGFVGYFILQPLSRTFTNLGLDDEELKTAVVVKLLLLFVVVIYSVVNILFALSHRVEYEGGPLALLSAILFASMMLLLSESRIVTKVREDKRD